MRVYQSPYRSYRDSSYAFGDGYITLQGEVWAILRQITEEEPYWQGCRVCEEEPGKECERGCEYPSQVNVRQEGELGTSSSRPDSTVITILRLSRAFNHTTEKRQCPERIQRRRWREALLYGQERVGYGAEEGEWTEDTMITRDRWQRWESRNIMKVGTKRYSRRPTGETSELRDEYTRIAYVYSFWTNRAIHIKIHFSQPNEPPE